MQISASIVLFKNDLRLNRAIECLIDSNCFSEVFLIDNSPSDALKFALVEIIKNPTVTYIFNNANIGFGAGHNVAIKKMLNTTTYHLVLNPDVYFENHIVAKLLAYMEENVEVGLVQPKILYPNGQLQYSCNLLPSPLDLIFKRFIPFALIKKRMGRFQLKFTLYNKEMEVPYLYGCFMLFRTAALKDIGLFDERFFMYPEDIDITRRMHEKYKTMFYPSVQIIHEHEQGSYKSSKLLFIHIKNMIKYFNKWGWIFDKKRKETNKAILNQFNSKANI